jgi:hypothetical protein
VNTEPRTETAPCLVCGAPIRLSVGPDDGCPVERPAFTPRWIQRMNASGLPPKDMTGLVAL